MISSMTQPIALPKPASPTAPPTAAKTSAPPAPETIRGSIGERAAGNIRAETQRAIDAPEQAAVLPRLRDEERANETERQLIETELPTGPDPTFEETPLERQARVALEPPVLVTGYEDVSSDDPQGDRPKAPISTAVAAAGDAPTEPPPSPRERAEVSFAETRSLVTTREGAALDIAR